MTSERETHLDCAFYWITFKILKIEYTEASSVLARLHLDGVTHPHCFSVDIISISFCIGLLSAACLKGLCAVNPITTYLRLVFTEKESRDLLVVVSLVYFIKFHKNRLYGLDFALNIWCNIRAFVLPKRAFHLKGQSVSLLTTIRRNSRIFPTKRNFKYPWIYETKLPTSASCS